MSLRIYSRAERGARHADGSGNRALPCAELWAHHSVTPAPPVNATFEQDAEAVRKLDDIGQQRFRQGNSYTFPICPSGRVFEGHSVHRIGAHTKGRNTIAAALCFIGNYETQELTPAQIESAAQLIAHGFLSGWWKAAKLSGGHQQAPGAATACPGRNVMAQLATIDRRAAEVARSAATLPPAPVAPAPTLASVRDQQTLLKAAGHYTGKVDGIVGPLHREAVRAWQRQIGFTGKDVDGIWGPATQARTDDVMRWVAAVERAEAAKKEAADLKAIAAALDAAAAYIAKNPLDKGAGYKGRPKAEHDAVVWTQLLLANKLGWSEEERTKFADGLYGDLTKWFVGVFQGNCVAYFKFDDRTAFHPRGRTDASTFMFLRG